MSFELEVDILNDQRETTSSMADLYGYSVFTEEFQKAIQLEQKRKEEEQDQTFQWVFTREPGDETKEVLQQVLQAETQVVVKEDFAVEEDTQMSIWEIMGFTLLGGLLSFGVWMVIEKIRKGRRIREDYNNH